MVSYRKNREAWLETVQESTQRKFHQSDLPLVFLGVLYTKMERLLGGDRRPEPICLREAMKWTCNTLLNDVMLSSMGEIELDRFGIGLFGKVLLRNFKAMLEDKPKSVLLEYPLDGFIVLNFALSNSVYRERLSASKRKRVVFLRFLYFLAEKYNEYLSNNEELLMHAAKEMVLLLNDPIGPRSLLRWDNIRTISRKFNNT